MAQATNLTTISRFHNLSNEAPADALSAMPMPHRRAPKRNANRLRTSSSAAVAGNSFTVTARYKAVKEYLGESYRRFEIAVVSTVVRIKAVQRFASAA
jgi:hypothetical protein